MSLIIDRGYQRLTLVPVMLENKRTGEVDLRVDRGSKKGTSIRLEPGDVATLISALKRAQS